MTPTLVYLNETTSLTDAEIQKYVAAQQIQVTRDFFPRWGLNAICVFAASAYDIPAGAWPIIIQDDAPDADELGVHDDRGVPYGVVAVRGDPNWTGTASHETLEMLADSTIGRTVVVDGTEYAFEVCDAPEDDQFGYEIDGVPMSAFVLPSWFDPAGVAPFAFPSRVPVSKPLQLAPGGYIGVRPIGGEWSQRLADGEMSRRQVKGAASRTMRRFRDALAEPIALPCSVTVDSSLG
jgi:hypothetical protein